MSFRFFAVTAVVTLVFIFQLSSQIEIKFLLVTLYLLILLTATELISPKAGLYAATLSIWLQIMQGFIFSPETQSAHITLAAIYASISGYYFLIRKFRREKLKRTQDRERHFRALVNASLQPMIIKNEKGEVMFASESLKDLLGLKRNLPVGKNLSEYIHPEDRHEFDKFLSKVIDSPNAKGSIEIRLKKQDNGYIWARNDAVNLLNHPGVKAILGSWQDITFQKTVDFHKSTLLRNEQEARAMAEKAVRDRDEFLSIASHELKTPLTSILLQLQATLRKILTKSLADFSGRDLVDSLQIAERQSQRLSILIKDLLNVSLASTGRITLNKERVNLSELVVLLTQKYSEEIKLSECEVKIETSDEIIGDWDLVRLEQALTNLLMNALKYAKGKKITLTTFKDETYAIFKIKDEGGGIPREIQQKIFEPFQRGADDKNVKGLGVGLFITRQIVLAHGGEIFVESKLGEGSTFTVKLPLAL